MKDWNIETLTGYKPISTFYMDLSIADLFGTSAIKDTYKNVMECWSDDYKYLTEFVLALNWKIWEHYKDNEPVARLYNDLWIKASEYAVSHLKGDELMYYYRTTD